MVVMVLLYQIVATFQHFSCISMLIGWIKLRHCHQVLCALERGQAMPWYPIKKRGQAETGVRSICVASLLMLIRGGLEAPNIFYLSKVGSILYFRIGIPLLLKIVSCLRQVCKV